MTRRIPLILVVLCLALTGMPAGEASAASGESDLISRINRERSSRGLRTLRVAGDLARVARRHSERMAASGRVSHNQNLPNEVDGWRSIAENVASGPTVRDVHNGMMRSGYHRQNVLDPRWTEIGVGVAYRRNRVYVTEVFVLRQRLVAAAPRVSRTRAPRRAPPAVRPAPKPAPPRPISVPSRTITVLLKVLLLDEPAIERPRPRWRGWGA